MRFATFGVVAAMAVTGATGQGFADDLQVASIPPIVQPVPFAIDSQAVAPTQAQTPPTELTPAVLAAYIARKQAQKGFDIFGETPAPQLTSALVSAYAATHYRPGNAALEAIDMAATPGLAETFTPQDVAPAAHSTITDDALARYAHSRYEPTVKKIAQANAERLCLSKAIYHEARGESDNGQWAVANVIINRAMSKRFPATMCGVIYQNANEGLYHCQFTFACDGQPDVATERRAWSKATRIAAAAYSEFQHGERPDVVPGSALFYHTRSVSPSWSNSYRRVAQIGAHVFYSPM